jgi:hypothetical protein
VRIAATSLPASGSVIASAPIFSVLEAEVALRGERAEHLVGEPARVLPRLGVRRELGLDEAPDDLPERLVLLGERRHRSGHGARTVPTR